MMGFLDRLVGRRAADPLAAGTAPTEAEQQGAGGPSQAVLDLSKSHLPALRARLAQFGYAVDQQAMFGDLVFWSVSQEELVTCWRLLVDDREDILKPIIWMENLDSEYDNILHALRSHVVLALDWPFQHENSRAAAFELHEQRWGDFDTLKERVLA